jgi:hypothetical protein
MFLNSEKQHLNAFHEGSDWQQLEELFFDEDLLILIARSNRLN